MIMFIFAILRYLVLHQTLIGVVWLSNTVNGMLMVMLQMDSPCSSEKQRLDSHVIFFFNVFKKNSGLCLGVK